MIDIERGGVCCHTRLRNAFSLDPISSRMWDVYPIPSYIRDTMRVCGTTSKRLSTFSRAPRLTYTHPSLGEIAGAVGAEVCPTPTQIMFGRRTNKV
jgi:hypothetical protein